MNLTDRGKVYLLICILSFVFSYSIITLNFFPHLGFALTFIIFALFSYKFKKVKDKDTKLYLLMTLIFSSFLFIRSDPFTTFLNLLAILFFGLQMLVPSKKEGFGFTDFIYAPILFIIKSVLTRSNYFLEYKEKKKVYKKVKIDEVVFGILITLLLMAVILPLLSSINPFFQKLVSDAWKFLSLENLLIFIGLENFFIWSIRLVFFLFFIFMIPKIITLFNKSYNYSIPSALKQQAFPLLIPKLILAMILFIFFVTQLQFYFASDQTFQNLGLNHSQRTREVFAQLSLVAGIVLLLIYNARLKGVFDRILNWTLGVQGIFLTAMAYKSVYEYINAWGLTHKRLYGLAFATLVAGIFVLFFNNYRQQKPKAIFVKKTIIFSGLILLIVNLLNFDYLIYYFKKAKTGQGIDYTYLSTLSPDSLSYKEQFLKLKELSEQNEYPQEGYDNKNPLIIIHKIESLQKKYLRFDLRTMNLLDFWQYQQIKEIDTGKLRAYYENKRPLKIRY